MMIFKDPITGQLKYRRAVGWGMNFVKGALGIAALIALAGLGIGSIDSMPPYAVVVLDDTTKTYIALPCIEEWRSRPSQAIDIVRRGTAGDAHSLGYDIDLPCRDAGGYIEDGRSLTGIILVKLGLLEPLTHWWDRPYRTEDGVVYPANKGSKCLKVC
jgi:hypothetical protein